MLRHVCCPAAAPGLVKVRHSWRQRQHSDDTTPPSEKYTSPLGGHSPERQVNGVEGGPKERRGKEERSRRLWRVGMASASVNQPLIFSLVVWQRYVTPLSASSHFTTSSHLLYADGKEDAAHVQCSRSVLSKICSYNDFRLLLATCQQCVCLVAQSAARAHQATWLSHGLVPSTSRWHSTTKKANNIKKTRQGSLHQ